jgi:hypothetical protein
MWWNCIFITLYYLINKHEKVLLINRDAGYVFTEQEEDEIAMLSTLKGNVFSRLDQYIRSLLTYACSLLSLWNICAENFQN